MNEKGLGKSTFALGYWKSSEYIKYLAKKKKQERLKVHFKFITQDKNIVYLCNWALSNPTRFAKKDKEVTCKNCKRIMNNFKIKNTGKKK